jgi:hypothetical protein
MKNSNTVRNVQVHVHNKEEVAVKLSRIVALVIAILFSGCASMEKSVVFGGVVGAAAGTGAGLLNQKSVGSGLIGAGIGAVLGGALAFLIHKDPPKEVVSDKEKKDEKVPSITTPDVRRVWVPEKIEGSKFIDGHFEYVIDRPSVWSK